MAIYREDVLRYREAISKVPPFMFSSSFNGLGLFSLLQYQLSRRKSHHTLTTNFNNIIMRMGQTSISKKQNPMSNLHLAGKEQILLGT